MAEDRRGFGAGFIPYSGKNTRYWLEPDLATPEDIKRIQTEEMIRIFDEMKRKYAPEDLPPQDAPRDKRTKMNPNESTMRILLALASPSSGLGDSSGVK